MNSDDLEILDKQPDMIEGFDDALYCVTYERVGDTDVLEPIALYDGNRLAEIACEQEGVEWEEALYWAASVEFSEDFNVHVGWPFALIEFEPELESEDEKPKLTLVKSDTVVH
jgi:hypothetical protein